MYDEKESSQNALCGCAYQEDDAAYVEKEYSQAGMEKFQSEQVDQCSQEDANAAYAAYASQNPQAEEDIIPPWQQEFSQDIEAGCLEALPQAYLHEFGEEDTELMNVYNQGCNLGNNQGCNLGNNQGCNLGNNQGCNLGNNQGCNLGNNQGCNLGNNQGCNLGSNQGCSRNFNRESAQGFNPPCIGSFDKSFSPAFLEGSNANFAQPCGRRGNLPANCAAAGSPNADSCIRRCLTACFQLRDFRCLIQARICDEGVKYVFCRGRWLAVLKYTILLQYMDTCYRTRCAQRKGCLILAELPLNDFRCNEFFICVPREPSVKICGNHIKLFAPVQFCRR